MPIDAMQAQAELRRRRAAAELARRRGLSGPVRQPSPAQEPQDLSLGQVARGAASNLLPSAGRLISDVTAPIHSPIQTAKGLGGIALGAAQKLIPGRQGSEQNIEALGTFFKDRYGGLENIKRTIAEDPAGILADLSGFLTGGAGLAAKSAGMVGRAAQVARTAAPATRGGRALSTISEGASRAAGAVERAAPAVAEAARAPGRAAAAVAGSAARGVGSTAAEILGLTTGASSTPIKVAFAAGREGGERGQMFVQSMRGNIPMEDVVTQAREAVGAMHKRKMDTYREGLGQVFSDRPEVAPKPPRVVTERRQSAILGPDGKPTTVTTKREIHRGNDLSKIDGAVKQILDQGAFKGVDISKSTAAMRKNIKGVMAEWKKLDPAEFHSVEGMDAMRKSIGDLVDSAPFGTPERRLANQAYFTVRKTIEAQAPGYGKVMSEYNQASTHLRDLEKALSLGKTAATETALRKLQAVMRNDVTSAYGQRARYAGELKGAGAGLLDEALAGQSLNPWMPRSMGSRVAGLGSGVATAAGAINPAALPLVGMASPRMVGGAAYRAGQGGQSLAELLSRVPRGTGQAAFQAGRAAGVQ